AGIEHGDLLVGHLDQRAAGRTAVSRGPGAAIHELEVVQLVVAAQAVAGTNQEPVLDVDRAVAVRRAAPGADHDLIERQPAAAAGPAVGRASVVDASVGRAPVGRAAGISSAPGIRGCAGVGTSADVGTPAGAPGRRLIVSVRSAAASDENNECGQPSAVTSQ